MSSDPVPSGPMSSQSAAAAPSISARSRSPSTRARSTSKISRVPAGPAPTSIGGFTGPAACTVALARAPSVLRSRHSRAKGDDYTSRAEAPSVATAAPAVRPTRMTTSPDRLSCFVRHRSGLVALTGRDAGRISSNMPSVGLTGASLKAVTATKSPVFEADGLLSFVRESWQWQGNRLLHRRPLVVVPFPQGDLRQRVRAARRLAL